MIAANPTHAVRAVLALYDEVAEARARLRRGVWRTNGPRRWMVDGFSRAGPRRAAAKASSRPAADSRRSRPDARCTPACPTASVCATSSLTRKRVESARLRRPARSRDSARRVSPASLLALEHTERLVVRTSVILAFPAASPMLTGIRSMGIWPPSPEDASSSASAPRSSRTWSAASACPGPNPSRACASTWSRCVRSGDRSSSANRCSTRAATTASPRLQPCLQPGSARRRHHRPPRSGSAASNEGMLTLAGSHADGIVTHPTNSNPRYLREDLPARL